jgi:hypothetical protein
MLAAKTPTTRAIARSRSSTDTPRNPSRCPVARWARRRRLALHSSRPRRWIVDGVVAAVCCRRGAHRRPAARTRRHPAHLDPRTLARSPVINHLGGTIFGGYLVLQDGMRIGGATCPARDRRGNADRAAPGLLQRPHPPGRGYLGGLWSAHRPRRGRSASSLAGRGEAGLLAGSSGYLYWPAVTAVVAGARSWPPWERASPMPCRSRPCAGGSRRWSRSSGSGCWCSGTRRGATLRAAHESTARICQRCDQRAPDLPPSRETLLHK